MSDAVLDKLTTTFGFPQFRGGQESCVRQLLNGDSSLAIFPTGSGKSLCYQLSATLLPNLTLVVSPLLALIQDQLEFLASKGIVAASIDSTLTPEQHQQVIADVRSGKVKILMVSVERFKNERFRQFIKAVPISMLVVDEAHCISEWGHNFRPDYLKLPSYRQELNIPLVLLLTATATRKVKKDMASKFEISPSHIVQTGFYRSNLNLNVLPVANRLKNNTLVSEIQNQQGDGIVYVTLQHTAEEVAAYLQQNGINAQAYHAGFDTEHRHGVQKEFMEGGIQVVVATIAFGMGIDKSDIRFVIHYDLPKSIENYSQEIGRAGRDGQTANCITLANLDGLNTVENFVYGDTPEHSGIDYVLENIQNDSDGDQWELQSKTLSNRSNIRELTLKTLLVQLELKDVLEPKYSYFSEYRFKFLQAKETILASFQGERQQFLTSVFNGTAFKKVWGDVNFDAIYQNSGGDRARVVTALEYLHEGQKLELQTKKMTDVFQVNKSNLASSALAGNLFAYFKDKEEKEIARIAALIRFFELNRCLSSNLARYFDDQAAPEACGHCSVCMGLVAKLQRSDVVNWPTEAQLINYVQILQQTCYDKMGDDFLLSGETVCRFLAGISVPLFTKLRARSLPGFGSCESQRFSDIRQVVETLN